MDLNEDEANAIDKFVNEKSLISPVITAQNLNSINSCPDQQMYRARIQFLFQVDSYVQNEMGEINEEAREVMIDMIHDAILFTADNTFPYAKSIVFLTIYITFLQQAIIQSHYEPEKLYRQYERILLKHSVERPPHSSGIFDLPDVKLLHDFFINSYFRNVKLIQNCLSKRHIMSFQSITPVSIPSQTLPALAEMEMEVDHSNLPEEKLEIPVEEVKPPNSSRKESGRTGSLHARNVAPTPGQSPLSSQRDSEQKSNQAEPAAGTAPSQLEAEDRGPEVPIDILRETLFKMHEKFVQEFDEKEHLLIGKIKEIEIKANDRQITTPKKAVRSGRK